MRVALVVMTVTLAACGGSQAPAASAPVPAPAPAPEPAAVASPPPPPAAAPVRDPELEREVTRLRVQVLERDAQIAELDRRLDEAMNEVVRAMARLRTLATRAEAASAIAEAEVAVEQLRQRAGTQRTPELQQAQQLLRSGSAEFDAGNFGGAVYLATQAKRVATVGRGRLAETGGGPSRRGETVFNVPVPLVTTSRANLRAGPGTTFDVVATVEPSTRLTGYAASQEWLRVTLADGRTAWVHQGLVRGAPGRP